MRFVLMCCLLLSVSRTASATTYYVSGNGSDTSDGLSPKTAFRTLQHAANLTEPGDVVYGMDGIYSIPAGKSAGAVLGIGRSGTADKWITYKAMPGQTPRIRTKEWNGVSFGPTVAYVELNGFTITGDSDDIDRETAIKRAKQPKPTPDPTYDGNCIGTDGRRGTETLKPNHLRILNNTVSKCGGGGISTVQADYVTISGNTIYDCAFYSIYGTSGISTLEDWNSDESTGYKMIITRNRLYGNKQLVWWPVQGSISDGEAIIIDTLRSPHYGTYKGRTLIANNVIYGNGSAAIEVFRSDHVDILNNSTYGNVLVPEETGRGELSLREAGDVNVLNNIFESGPGQNPLNVNTRFPCTCKLGSNIYFGGAVKPAGLMGPNDLLGDPEYLNVDLNQPLQVDLHVKANSPALKSGTRAIDGRILDFAGTPRPTKSAWDRGAFQQ